MDRFIDEDRKLGFSTYEVENSKQAKQAIEKNGLLEVEFYAEVVYKNPFTLQGNTSTWTYYGNQGSGGNYWLNGFGGTITNCVSGSTTTSISNGVSFTNCSSTSTLTSDASIETGRVEKGEKSNQSFSESFDSFNSWISFSTKVQILPRSQKPAETSEIRSYCTGCGSRNKKQNWKFCPNCGTKI